MTIQIIKKFDGDHFFLSNFYRVDITFDSMDWITSEHAYQAAKYMSPVHRQLIQAAPSPAATKRIARATANAQWPAFHSHKLNIMERILRVKFSIPHLDQMLRATGDAYLIEGNTWGDRYWGEYQGVGENHLGRILMKIRDEL